jgi:HEAT repeat protein
MIALQLFWDDAVEKVFLRMLQSPDPALRWLAADGLAMRARRGDDRVHAALLEALGDHQPGVRCAIARAIGQIGAEGAADNLVTALAFDEGREPLFRQTLLRAIERLGKPGVQRLLGLADAGVQKDTSTVVEAFLAMRSRAAAESLPALLRNPHLSIAQRADLIRSCAGYRLDPPVSLEPIFEYLVTQGDDALPVKQAAAEILAQRGNIAPAVKAREWLLRVLEDTDPDLRRKAIPAAEAMRLAEASPRLLQILRDAARPREERAAAARALRVFEAERLLRDEKLIQELKRALENPAPNP